MSYPVYKQLYTKYEILSLIQNRQNSCFVYLIFSIFEGNVNNFFTFLHALKAVKYIVL
jgi:hypothetical protein